jgi:hypothetical protein
MRQLRISETMSQFSEYDGTDRDSQCCAVVYTCYIETSLIFQVYESSFTMAKRQLRHETRISSIIVLNVIGAAPLFF